MRSLGQPVGSLAADLIGVSMITCKNDRLLELLWFVGYCIEFPTQLAVRNGIAGSCIVRFGKAMCGYIGRSISAM